MIKRIQKLLGKCAMHLSSFSSSGVKAGAITLFLVFFLGINSVFAQGVSLGFSSGYLGTQGTNTNQANNIKKMSTLGIARITFGQSYAGSFGGTQGNDLSGTLKLYLTNGNVITLLGALNWRETTGSTVEVFGFI